MLRVLAAGAVIIGGALASPALAGWTAVEGAVAKASDPLSWWSLTGASNTASYWSQPAAAPDGERQVEVVTLNSWIKGGSPRFGVLRIRLDCETGVGRQQWAGSYALGETFGGASERWSSPRYYGQRGPGDLRVFACGQAAAGPLPDLAAVAADAARRLGYATPPDPNAPPPPLMIPPAPVWENAPAVRNELGPQQLVWEDGRTSVFLMSQGLARDGALVSGRSMWLSGAGRGEEQQGYLVRSFRADCAARTIGLTAVGFWPRAGTVQGGAPPASPVAPESQAQAAMLAGACGETTPKRTLASTSDLLAYAVAPDGDLAFIARRQKTIEASDMLWSRTPSNAALAQALPPGKVETGQKKYTFVYCIVGRGYRLQDCQKHHGSDDVLDAAHLALMEQYRPAKSVNGDDTLGRRVVSRITWTSEGGQIEPVQVPLRQMQWSMTPSIKNLEKAYGSTDRAEATMYCRVGPIRLLDQCRALARVNGVLKEVTDPATVEPDAAPNLRFAAALLRRSQDFVPALLTTIGEETAGRGVMIPVSWPPASR